MAMRVLAFLHKPMSALIGQIIAFIAAGLAILGLVPHQQIQQVPQPPQQAVKEVKSGTQTYTNFQYGFSIQIPDSAKVSEFQSFNYTDAAITGTDWTLSIIPGASTGKGSDYSNCKEDSANIVLAGKSAVRRETDCPNGVLIYIFFNEYPTSWASDNEIRVFTSHEKLPFVEQILSTFKFTASQGSPVVSVPGMEKYTDADFGFSFWYPSGFTIGKKQTNFYHYGNNHEFLAVQSPDHQVGRIVVNETIEGLMCPEETKVSTSTAMVGGVVAMRTLTSELAANGSVVSTTLELSFEKNTDQYYLSFAYNTPGDRMVADEIVRSFSF